ncbi:MAG TPA: SpoIIE family protein phosphatase, partial [Tepidisphaeraceae bacterium]
VRLGIGDLVFCYTDAFIEAQSVNGEMLGAAGLCTLVQTVTPDPVDPPSLIARLLHALARHSPENLTRDYLTGLLIRPNGTLPDVPWRDRLAAPFRRIAARAGLHFS